LTVGNKRKEMGGIGRKMLCEYKNKVMYISCKTLELFRENYYDEYKKVKILAVHPHYVNYKELVEIMKE